MRKMIALCFCILFAAGVCFGFPAAAFAAEKEAPGVKSGRIWYGTLNSVKNPVSLKYRTTMDGEPMTVTLMIRPGGVPSHIDMASPSEHIGVLMTGKETVYILVHDEKMYLKLPEPPEDLSPLLDRAEEETGDESQHSRYTLSHGREKINGKEYYFEKVRFGEDEDEQVYYYDDDTKEAKWRYWIHGDQQMEILSYGEPLKDSDFALPRGYEEMRL